MAEVIRFNCVSCGKAVTAEARFAGRGGSCPRCGTAFTVPSVVPDSRYPADSPDAAPEIATGELSDLASAARASAAATRGKPRAPVSGRRTAFICAIVGVIAVVALGTVITLLLPNFKGRQGDADLPRSGATADTFSGRTPASPALAGDPAKLEREIVEQLRSIENESRADAMLHRKAMERLCDELGRAALREPGLRRFKDVEALEQVVLQSVSQGISVSSDTLRGYRGLFHRTETQAVIDRMIAESERVQAETRRREGRASQLQERRPSRAVALTWSPLSERADAVLREAEALTSSSITFVPRDLSRDGLLASLDDVDREAARRQKKADELQRELREQRRIVDDFAAGTARAFPSIVRSAQESATAIDEAGRRLGAAKNTDVTGATAYHRALLGKLPPALESLDSLILIGKTVSKARSETPREWSLSGIFEGYATWQAESFKEFLNAGAGKPLHAASREHQAALAGWSSDEKWHDAASRIPADDLPKLTEFLTKHLLNMELIGNRGLLLTVVSDAGEEHRVIWPENLGDLYPVSPVLAVRRLRLPGEEAAARAHHRSIFQRLLERSALTELAALRTLVENRARAHPTAWPETVREHYARYQVAQWEAFAEERLGDGAKPSAEVLDGVRKLLDGGVIIEERFPERARWEDRYWELRQADKTNRPPLAALNPYELTRKFLIPTEHRQYHLALLRKMNANESVSALTVMKQTVDDEQQASPQRWEFDKVFRPGAPRPPRPDPAGMYAELQAAQWVAYFDKKLRPHADEVMRAYYVRHNDKATWSKVARRLKSESGAMSAFVQSGMIDEQRMRNAVEELARRDEGKAFRSASYIEFLNSWFWQAIRDGK